MSLRLRPMSESTRHSLNSFRESEPEPSVSTALKMDMSVSHTSSRVYPRSSASRTSARMASSAASLSSAATSRARKEVMTPTISGTNSRYSITPSSSSSASAITWRTCERLRPKCGILSTDASSFRSRNPEPSASAARKSSKILSCSSPSDSGRRMSSPKSFASPDSSALAFASACIAASRRASTSFEK